MSDELKAAQAEIKRLQPFAEWVRDFGAHAADCPAFEKERNVECTCGFRKLWEAAKKK